MIIFITLSLNPPNDKYDIKDLMIILMNYQQNNQNLKMGIWHALSNMIYQQN